MTEHDWQTSTEPLKMLEFLRDSGTLSERKGRLLAVACCRRIWHLLSDERSRRAVETAEQFADSRGSPEELWAVVAGARNAVSDPMGAAFAAWAAAGGDQLFTSVIAATAWASREAAEAAAGIPHAPTDADPWPLTHPAEFADRQGAWQAERSQQACCLRCIVGPLPFRTVPILPPVLAWNDGCVQKLTTLAYEERALPSGTLDAGRLAVVADALEEAGLDDATILSHLREQDRQHHRGCFVLDLLLGKS
jgi:hypothetical protein